MPNYIIIALYILIILPIVLILGFYSYHSFRIESITEGAIPEILQLAILCTVSTVGVLIVSTIQTISLYKCNNTKKKYEQYYNK